MYIRSVLKTLLHSCVRTVASYVTRSGICITIEIEKFGGKYASYVLPTTSFQLLMLLFIQVFLRIANIPKPRINWQIRMRKFTTHLEGRKSCDLIKTPCENLNVWKKIIKNLFIRILTQYEESFG
jgi:hypothetical protein